MEKKLLKKFIVLNETKKEYSSMPALARILNKPQRTLYYECKVANEQNIKVRYVDDKTGDTFIVSVFG